MLIKKCFPIWFLYCIIFTDTGSVTQDKSELTHGDRYTNYQRCFQDRHAYSKLSLVETNLKDVLQLDLKNCFEPLTLSQLFPELHTTNVSYLEHFDNLTARYCPNWSNSSKCFYDFVNQNCSHGDINDIMISPATGKSLLFTELVCHNDKNIRQIVRGYIKDAVNQGLVECYKESKSLRTLFNSCQKFKCKKETLLPLMLPFEECVRSYFECVQPFFELCVPFDRLDEARNLWTSIENTLKDYHLLLYS
ncbi:unnamed protein product [Allacma fusca]|uniref:Uncharacterized protein n=1 Tax=Allacma fusca TaxID=39272 RepID=A0A8J2KQB6_9HEXA|nr:unnamed protein product [Allacma fusca]